ncbi:MAG: hypothetical protein NTZ97_01335 [Candidatus Moranbacteria bacterium]|nr:hypothetical protein [Candidatus Moranbacteria bacterium]
MKRKIIIVVTTIVIIALMVPVVFFGLYFLSMGGLYDIMYSAKYRIVSISGNPDLCEKFFKDDEYYIPSWYLRYGCYMDFAIDKNNENICEKIPKIDKFERIRTRCYDTIAIKNKNLTLCAQAEDGYCYGVIGGKTTGDPNLCANLKGNKIIASCYFYLWSTYEYSDAGKNLGKINSNCERIADNEKRKLCMDIFKVRDNSENIDKVMESFN